MLLAGMPHTLTAADYERYSRETRELRHQAEQLTVSLTKSLGEEHAATVKATEVEACLQLLQWALDRSRLHRSAGQ